MSNKAHTATMNRICAKYGFEPHSDGPFDIQTEELIIEVETSASVKEAVTRLLNVGMPSYIAVTNKEGLGFAKEQVRGSSIGILDPQGNVILKSGDHELTSPDIPS